MTPSEEGVVFYYELGLAATRWAHVENDLCVLALSFFAQEERNALALGFFSIENFRSKLQFTDAVVTRNLAATQPSLIPEWESLANRIRSAAAMRNQMVHRHVVVYPQNTAGKRYALIPWISKEPKTDKERSKPPAGSMFVREINKARLVFFAIVASLTNFAARAHGQKEQLPRSNEQPMNPMTIAQLKRQIHVAPGAQRLSSRERRRLEDEQNAAASLENGEKP
jgi:hypothetical protein